MINLCMHINIEVCLRFESIVFYKERKSEDGDDVEGFEGCT